MVIYAANIALALAWGLLSSLVPARKAKAAIRALPFIQLYLIMALRSDSVGTDTAVYHQIFDQIVQTDWRALLIRGNHLLGGLEWGYLILTKTISVFTSDFQVYNMIVCAVMLIPLYLLVRRYSSMHYLSVVLFVALGFFNFYLSAMRQALAMSIVMLSFPYLRDKKAVPFLACVTLAALLHRSAVFFYPAILAVDVNLARPSMISTYMLVLVLTFLARAKLFALVTKFAYASQKAQPTGAYTLLGVVFVTLVVSLVFYRDMVRDDEAKKLSVNLLAVAVALMVFNTVSMLALRVAYYYYVFAIVMIPDVLKACRYRELRAIGTMVVLLFVVAYYLAVGVHALDAVPYRFFWANGG